MNEADSDIEHRTLLTCLNELFAAVLGNGCKEITDADELTNAELREHWTALMILLECSVNHACTAGQLDILKSCVGDVARLVGDTGADYTDSSFEELFNRWGDLMGELGANPCPWCPGAE